MALKTLNLQDNYPNLPTIVVKLLEEPENLARKEKSLLRHASIDRQLLESIKETYNQKMLFSHKEEIIDFDEYLKKILETSEADFNRIKPLNLWLKEKLLTEEDVRKIYIKNKDWKTKQVYINRDLEIVKINVKWDLFDLYAVYDIKDFFGKNNIQQIGIKDSSGNERKIFVNKDLQIVEATKWDQKIEICDIWEGQKILANGESIKSVNIWAKRAYIDKSSSILIYTTPDWKEEYFDWKCEVFPTTDISKPLFQKGINADWHIFLDN